VAVAEQVEHVDDVAAGDAGVGDEVVGELGVAADAGQQRDDAVEVEAAQGGGDVEGERGDGAGDEEAVVAEALVARQHHDAGEGGVDRAAGVVGDELAAGDRLEVGEAGEHHEGLVGGQDHVAVADLDHRGDAGVAGGEEAGAAGAGDGGEVGLVERAGGGEREPHGGLVVVHGDRVDVLAGLDGELRVTHIGWDKELGVVAVQVESDIPSENDIPHITLAVSPTGKPRDSNKITNWKPVGRPLTLKGQAQDVHAEGEDKPKLTGLAKELADAADGARELAKELRAQGDHARADHLEGLAKKYEADSQKRAKK